MTGYLLPRFGLLIETEDDGSLLPGFGLIIQTEVAAGGGDVVVVRKQLPNLRGNIVAGLGGNFQ